MNTFTPMMKQYLRIKAEYQDCILFFRMGDFYEMFFEDAKVASKILEIALTSRERGEREKIPLCGVPYHAAGPYIAKLIERGHKVAICEQVGDVKGSKGLVEREVIQVITPGMIVEGESLKEKENNFLMSLWQGAGAYGLSFLDLSTGEFKGCRVNEQTLIVGEVLKNRPREVVVPTGFKEEGILDDLRRELPSIVVTSVPDSSFWTESEALSMEGLIPTWVMDEPLRAAIGTVQYVRKTQKTDLGHIKPFSFYRVEDFLILDETTQRNLELFTSLRGGGKRNTFFGVLDETITAMGGRRLREWLCYPLKKVYEIERRLDAIARLKEAPLARAEIRELLEEVYDLERLNTRVTMGKANPRDLVALKTSLQAIPRIKAALGDVASALLHEVREDLDGLNEVVWWIGEAILDDPPITTTEGGIIRDGYDEELDELRRISRDGKGWIAQLEVQERKRTRISSLKVRYNQVFGYYIEVTKPNLHLIPEDYRRKQTLVNAERFITPELKEYENKVLGAEERIKSLEYELFRRLREQVAGQNRRIQGTASAVAALDVIVSLAEVADKYGYTRPQVTEGDEITIVEGRHPIVERMGHLEPFVPNDTRLNTRENQLIILTGPNMAGKSTYIRQVALIVLMAHMGVFVPATESTIGLVDRIFTRVGASDNLTMGESTFMVEMRETADILKEVTPRSLVILDEIGRGTSTFDGLSIAWAVAEYLHDRKGPKTLFATHYHELTELIMTKSRVKNYTVAVSEWNGEIIFLRRIVEGGANRSYGIQVARLAGLPDEVVTRAKEVLANLEKGELDEKGLPRLAQSKGRREEHEMNQLSLFKGKEDPLYQELKEIDPDSLTPLEAIRFIYQWKKMIKEGD